METIAYAGWKNCIRLSNTVIDLVITADVGPRIIRFGFVGGDNEFKEFDEMTGQTGGEAWRVYGGHRLWHAPEDPTRTYAPDNAPVQTSLHGDGVRVVQPVEATTGIQKEMDIFLAPNAAQVTVIHRLRNINLWSIELAPWALSVMAPGGVGFAPLPLRGSHPDYLVPTSTLAIWPYTDMTDPRWTWGERLVRLQQQPGNEKPQKIGVHAPDGWVAYLHNGRLFVKTFAVAENGRYPDLNSTVELFTNADMLEVETLGPLTTLPPDGAVTHTETWHLLDNVPDEATDEELLDLVQSLL